MAQPTIDEDPYNQRALSSILAQAQAPTGRPGQMGAPRIATPLPNERYRLPAGTADAPDYENGGGGVTGRSGGLVLDTRTRGNPYDKQPVGSVARLDPSIAQSTVQDNLTPEQVKTLTDWNNGADSRRAAVQGETDRLRSSGWDGRAETRGSNVMGDQEAERARVFGAAGLRMPPGYDGPDAEPDTDADDGGGGARTPAGFPKLPGTVYDGYNEDGSGGFSGRGRVGGGLQPASPGDVGPTTTFADGSTMPTTNAQNEATLAAQPANTQHLTGTPRAESPAGGPGGKPFASEGFDSTKFGKNDPKYVFHDVAEQYDWNDPAQRQAALEALRAHPSGFFRNASLKGDILDVGSGADPSFNGITRFDIQKDTEHGGPLHWEPAGDGTDAAGGASGANPSGFAAMGPASGRTQNILDGMNGSGYDSLLARLQAILGPEAVDQQALSKLLAQRG